MDDLEEAAVAPAGEGEGLVSLGVVSALGREDMSHMGGGVLRTDCQFHTFFQGEGILYATLFGPNPAHSQWLNRAALHVDNDAPDSEEEVPAVAPREDERPVTRSGLHHCFGARLQQEGGGAPFLCIQYLSPPPPSRHSFRPTTCRLLPDCTYIRRTHALLQTGITLHVKLIFTPLYVGQM